MSKEATHNNTPIEPTRHALPVRRQMATAAAAAQRDTITATSASPELIGNTDGQGMNMLLELPTQQHLIPPDDQSLRCSGRTVSCSTAAVATNLTCKQTYGAWP